MGRRHSQCLFGDIKTRYHWITGRGLERLAALSGGIFEVAMTPFSTKLTAKFITYRLTPLLYWTNILALGVVLYSSWRYAERSKLLKSGVPAEVGTLIEHRISIAQSLYAVRAL